MLHSIKIPKIKLKKVEGGGGGNKKEEKKIEKNRSKQTRPFTPKVAKLLKLGYAKRDFKHNATNADHFYGYVFSNCIKFLLLMCSPIEYNVIFYLYLFISKIENNFRCLTFYISLNLH